MIDRTEACFGLKPERLSADSAFGQGIWLAIFAAVTGIRRSSASAQKEILYIRTQLSPPYPNHQEAVELAALIRVRDLLEKQIQAMLTP
jgi:hypothetical protein